MMQNFIQVYGQKNSQKDEEQTFPPPRVYPFTEVVNNIQSTTYTRLNTLSVNAQISKIKREKQQFVLQQYQKYQAADISRFDFLKITGYKFRKNFNQTPKNCI